MEMYAGNHNKSLTCDNGENNNKSNSNISKIEPRIDGCVREEINYKKEASSEKKNDLTQDLLAGKNDTAATYLKKSTQWSDVI